jgi:hypothetical protein
MTLDPQVWGPFYWFFLYTLAISYPKKANEVLKKKYYDLIQNLPIFIPSIEIGNKFSLILDKYPVEPYLDTRDNFIKWVHFIHNKINLKLGKSEISYVDAMNNYYMLYKPKDIQLKEELRKKKIIIIFAICAFLIFVSIYLYKK